MTASRSVRPHVVIVGAGFGGLSAAKKLREKPVEVTLVDRNNYHRFQPLLYQVATAGLEPGDVAHNVRDIFRGVENVTFRLGTVQSVDQQNQQLLMRSGPPIGYDYLILATGAVTEYFGIDGASSFSLPLKNLPDAIDLRNHLLRLFERVDRDREGVAEGALNVVVVGGGPTGVETAGALVELFHVMKDDYRNIDADDVNVFLLEMMPALLPPFQESLQDYTRRTLERRGVNVRTDTAVSEVTDGRVILEDGDEIATQTLIWAAGVRGHPLAETTNGRVDKAGRLAVESDLRLTNDPEVFAIGDVAGVGPDRDPYPQLAPVAVQQGKHAARQILRLTDGEPTEPFQYDDPGMMSTIGRNAAVVQLGNGVTLKGYFAWLAWVLIHIAKLVGFRNRAVVFLSWIYNYFTYDKSARLILNVVPIAEDIPRDPQNLDEEVKEKLSEVSQNE